MSTTRRFAVAGESLLDIVVGSDGSTTRSVGGSPLNVAVGLARLEVPSLLVTRLGDDDAGATVQEYLDASGVLLAPEAVVAGTTTSTATARLGAGNAADYDFDLTWDLAPTELSADALGLHIGSLGATLLPGRDAVLDLVRQALVLDVFVSYDPNVRPRFVTEPEAEWRQMVELAGRARLVKVSDEDLHALRPDADVDGLVAELLTGPETELVVVTWGNRGATAYTRRMSVHTDAVPVDVVDTVGAGDAFMAAVLAALVDWEATTAGPGALRGLGEHHVRTLLDGALLAAAVTCSRRGANPPTRQELPTTWPAR